MSLWSFFKNIIEGIRFSQSLSIHPISTQLIALDKLTLIFMELVQPLQGGGLWLSNEHKKQTKVELLIHQGRTWTFSLFWVAKQ